MIPEKISNEEANTLAAYEPIDSEFRKHAYKKWGIVRTSNSIYGPNLMHVEPDVKIPSHTHVNYTEIEDLDTIFDYFPLDGVENPTAAFSFSLKNNLKQIAKLSIFQRTSIWLRKSFRICAHAGM